jgi:hypothetical protein
MNSSVYHVTYLDICSFSTKQIILAYYHGNELKEKGSGDKNEL